jgi:hypothetical protein
MVKKLLFVVCLGLSLASCKNETKEADVAEANVGTENPEAANGQTVDLAAAPAAPAGPTTAIKFEEMEYDFGSVKDGEKVTKIFKFTNTGKEPLVLTNVQASCGCTTPEWPKEAIAPGKSGEIKAVFDSTGKGSAEGASQSKTIDVTANTEPAVTNLRLFGTVVSSPKAQTAQ